MTALKKKDATPVDVSPIEQAMIMGDLSALSESQRAAYYQQVCDSVGLNPLTRPFQYINLNGKLTLYATKDAAAQIRKTRGISFTSVEKDVDLEAGVVTYTVTGTDKNGREDTEIGAVSIWQTQTHWKNNKKVTTLVEPLTPMNGEELCNAYMKALTKAKRRLSLSLGGLGWLDETELETIPTVQPVAKPQVKTLNPQAQVELLPAEPEKLTAQENEALDTTIDIPDEDLIAASDVELKRIGLTPRHGRQLLMQLFEGVTSRSELSSLQLRIFLTALMKQPTAQPVTTEK